MIKAYTADKPSSSTSKQEDMRSCFILTYILDVYLSFGAAADSPRSK